MSELPRIEKTFRDNDRIGEIQDRLRRMETRLTAWMKWSGWETETGKPQWVRDGVVDIPSTDVKLKDVLESVPGPWKHCKVYITHKGRQVCSLYIED
jgi:hypothetical protein